MSKVDRTAHGPSWVEVILGAFLSLLLGALLAIVVLALRPAVAVKELPKAEERKRDVVYYVEGSKDTSKARQALAKRKAFVEGQTITLNEDEVNALIGGDSPPAAQAKAAPKAGEKKGEKKAEPAAADTGETVGVGTPNVRIREGVVQVAAPVTVSVLGVSEKVTFQARGGFAKNGEVFTYDPSEMYVGSLPVQRLPIVNSYVRNKILSARPVPEDLAAAWRKLKEVTVEGSTIRLSP